MTALDHFNKNNLSRRRMEGRRKAVYSILNRLRETYPFWIASELKSSHIQRELCNTKDLAPAWLQFQERMSDAVLEKYLLRSSDPKVVKALLHRSQWIHEQLVKGTNPRQSADAVVAYYFEMIKFLFSEVPKYFNKGEIMRMLTDYFFLQRKENFNVSYSVINELPDEQDGPVEKLLDWFRRHWKVGPEQELLGSGA